MESQETPADDWQVLSKAVEDARGEEDDGPSVNILSSEGLVVEIEKIPLEQAANLIIAREAAALIRRDEISLDEYLERMSQVAEVADNGVKLFSAEVVQKELEKLPEEQRELIGEFARQVHKVKEGVDLMFSFADTGDIDELDRGLEMIEQAMLASDQIQDQAIEMERLEQEARAEQAEEDEDAYNSQDDS